jgi:hypothetical protein
LERLAHTVVQENNSNTCPPCAIQEILSSVVYVKEYLRYRGGGLVSSFVWSRLANGEPILADVWSVFYKTCCAGRGHTREHSWSATAATTCGRMGTAFFRTGTCISRLDNFDHVRTKRVWNWHDFFLWTKFRSGQVRANVMSPILFDWRKGTLSIHGSAWVLQSRSMTRKGGCWKLVDSQDVGASQFTGSVSDAQWRSLWNYFQRGGLGAICCLIRFFPLLRLVIFSCCCARMSI